MGCNHCQGLGRWIFTGDGMPLIQRLGSIIQVCPHLWWTGYTAELLGALGIFAIM